MGDIRQQEDTLIRKVLAVALTKDQMPAGGASSLTVLLEGLAEELSTDAMGAQDATLLSKDQLDRVIVARLIEQPQDSYPQTPLEYLMACYSRASEEARSRAVAEQPALAAAAQACRELIINYAALTLSAGIIPHTGQKAEAAEARGPLQLLDAMDARIGARTAPPGAVPLAPGFMEDLAAKFDADDNMDGLKDVIRPVVKELAKRVRGCSALGEYAAPMSCMRALVDCEPIARALVSVREWLPNLKDTTGRGIELPGCSWLGPCFCPSPLDDRFVKGQPHVGEQCFSDATNRRPGDVQQSMRALQMASKQIHNEQIAIVKALLSNKGRDKVCHTREPMINWLAAVVEGNRERGKMQWDPERGASHGFFINLNAAMLALSAPFLESPNFWKRVDVRYVAHNPRLDFAEDTKLGATQSEDTAWRERVASGAQASSSSSSNSRPNSEGGIAAANGSVAAAAGGGQPDYHFICECFFITMKSLHYGLIKMIDDFNVIVQNLGRWRHDLQELTEQAETMRGSLQGLQAAAQLPAWKQHVKNNEMLMCEMQAVLTDQDFMGEVLAFYRLVAAWLLWVAAGSPPDRAGMSGMLLPLPATPPLEFTTPPEWMLEDLIDLLSVVSQHYPPVLMTARMDEVMMLMIATMDQPQYVRSSHVRAKMAELLFKWLPQDDTPQAAGRARRFAPKGSLSVTLTHLFQGHPVVCERLVPALLKLYVDVEVMDVRNQFYEKFNFRMYIGEILAHLWELPQHKEAWKRYAAAEGTGTAGYVRFANMLITDATYLLDESLKKIGDVKTKSAALQDPATSPQERAELAAAVESAGGQLRALLQYAQVTVSILNFSTEEVTATFLLPEMVERTACMLNYFQALLTGAKRKQLAIKEPEKYNFRPRELLANLMQVYLHLSAADRSGTFARAIAGDARCYDRAMFAEAARVLGSAGMLSPPDAARLDALDAAVQSAADVAAEQEDLLQGVEVPDEFQDPMMYELMRDPVLLPTSGSIMDKAVITRHLLTDQRDPMSRAPLTPDMLVPQPDLKARIETWVRETKAARMAARQQQQ